VNKDTCQHVRYPNVFSLGDCSSLPTSKTIAAITSVRPSLPPPSHSPVLPPSLPSLPPLSEAPVLVHNLVKVMKGETPNAVYDGYTSCPLVTVSREGGREGREGGREGGRGGEREGSGL